MIEQRPARQMVSVGPASSKTRRHHGDHRRPPTPGRLFANNRDIIADQGGQARLVDNTAGG